MKSFSTAGSRFNCDSQAGYSNQFTPILGSIEYVDDMTIFSYDLGRLVQPEQPLRNVVT
jgi:hypothetical protein